MGLFKCAKCNGIDNTALGMYWVKNRPEIFDWDESNQEYKGKALCCECAPKTFSDSHKPTGYGKWHNKFPKEEYNGQKDVYIS